MFYICIFSNTLDLLQTKCSITVQISLRVTLYKGGKAYQGQTFKLIGFICCYQEVQWLGPQVPGWPYLANFSQLGYFWMLIMTFSKDKVAQINGNILGYFLLKQIYYIFTLISSFKIWFVVAILSFWKWFDVDDLGFQIELCCGYFGLFCLETVWATFWKIGWFFFKSSRHSLRFAPPSAMKKNLDL